MDIKTPTPNTEGGATEGAITENPTIETNKPTTEELQNQLGEAKQQIAHLNSINGGLNNLLGMIKPTNETLQKTKATEGNTTPPIAEPKVQTKDDIRREIEIERKQAELKDNQDKFELRQRLQTEINKYGYVEDDLVSIIEIVQENNIPIAQASELYYFRNQEKIKAQRQIQPPKNQKKNNVNVSQSKPKDWSDVRKNIKQALLEKPLF